MTGENPPVRRDRDLLVSFAAKVRRGEGMVKIGGNS